MGRDAKITWFGERVERFWGCVCSKGWHGVLPVPGKESFLPKTNN
jgi:hypothetical protein